MNDLLRVAISRALGVDAAKKKLPAGEYSIDARITLRVKGKVRKGEDYQQIIPQSLRWQQGFYLLAQHCSSKVVEHAIKIMLNGNNNDEVDKHFKKSVDAAIEKYRKTATKTCTGKVTGDVSLAVEAVEDNIDNNEAAL